MIRKIISGQVIEYGNAYGIRNGYFQKLHCARLKDVNHQTKKYVV